MIAAGAALVTVRLASRTLREAEAAREAAERDSRRRLLVHIADCIQNVDNLAWNDMQRNPPGTSWKHGRHRLQIALAGLSGELPNCAQILNAQSPAAASNAVTTARQEVEAKLQRIAEMDAEAARSPHRSRAAWRKWSHRR